MLSTEMVHIVNSMNVWNIITHGPVMASFGGGGEENAAGAITGAVAACVAGGAADGAGASGGGISTCFQSCPSSTMRAMRVPRRTL